MESSLLSMRMYLDLFVLFSMSSASVNNIYSFLVNFPVVNNSLLALVLSKKIKYKEIDKALGFRHGKVRPGSCPEGKKGGGLSQSPDKVIPPHNSPLPISKSPHPTNPAWNKTKRFIILLLFHPSA